MLAQATTARGMAATSPVQRRPMLPRSHAAAARPSGHGSTCLPAVAHLRSPVAAAGSGSGISSHAAIKAIKAWLAVPDLLAGASAAVAAWWKPPTLAVQLGTAVVIALIGIGVWLTNIVAKREFDERCKHKKVRWMLLRAHGLRLVVGARCNAASCGQPSLKKE